MMAFALNKHTPQTPTTRTRRNPNHFRFGVIFHSCSFIVPDIEAFSSSPTTTATLNQPYLAHLIAHNSFSVATHMRTPLRVHEINMPPDIKMCKPNRAYVARRRIRCVVFCVTSWFAHTYMIESVLEYRNQVPFSMDRNTALLVFIGFVAIISQIECPDVGGSWD